MILISHRGNIDGKFDSCENEPCYIDIALDKGYDVEIDIWYTDYTWYLGHDNPQYGIPVTWLEDRKKKLWVHCKNIEAIEKLSLTTDLNYFWHESDTVTITSKNYIWAYPKKGDCIQNSIVLFPEVYNTFLTGACGICSDNILKCANEYRNSNIRRI